MQESQANFDEKQILLFYVIFLSRPKGKKGKGKKKGSDDSGSDFDLDTSDIGPARDRPGTLFNLARYPNIFRSMVKKGN